MRTLRALVLLCGALLRRLLREGLVLRSLLFPPVITVVTLVGTVGVVILLQSPPQVAVPQEGLPEPVETALAEAEVRLLPVPDSRQAVASRQARVGTDGQTVFLGGDGPEATALEAALREHHGATWTPAIPIVQPPMDPGPAGALIARLLGAIFALYAVVLGAGMVARDRDDGTLEVELALPVPRYVHGLARWLAATTLLALVVVPSLVLFDAIFGVPRLEATLRHVLAAGSASAALGLLVIGRAGLKRGFSGPLAVALTATLSLFGVGVALPALAPHLPIASLAGGGPGWSPLGVAVALGLLASWRLGRAGA